MKRIYRTLKQQWLLKRGGREESDILVDEIGEYILMWDSKQGMTIKIYLPKFRE